MGGITSFEVRQWISDRIRVAERGYITPCWVWPGWLTPKGYAKVTNPLLGERRVHRAAYVAWVGPIPDGLTIDHLCRVKNCCNPAHLEPVTALENARRAAQLLPKKTHCKCGIELTPETATKGKSWCKACRAAYGRDWEARHPRRTTKPTANISDAGGSGSQNRQRASILVHSGTPHQRPHLRAV